MYAKDVYPQGQYFLVNKWKKGSDIITNTWYIRLTCSTCFIIKQVCKLK